jgi:hypothetical protein
VQVPVPHDSLAWARLQATPQAPQFANVVRAASQPLLGLLSQFPYPDVHAGTQTLEVQAVVPCALVQALPQAAQFETVPSCVSQPSVAMLLQLAQPERQEPIWQVPLEHEGFA